MLDRKHEYGRMAAVEGALWWYRALHHLVLDVIRAHAPGPDPAILDAGCGTGGLALFLRANGLRNLQLFDAAEDAVAWCRARELDARQGNLLDLRVLCPERSADVVVSNDTLCYLDPGQQEEMVRQCARILRPGGLLILNLPALRAFGGIHDVSVGIKQRFSRADVPRLLQPQWFEVVRQCYWPFLLSPLIYAARAGQRRAMRRGPDFTVRSDIDLPPRWLNRTLYFVTRAENRLLSRKPFGSSLFVVGRRRPGPVSPPGR